jgi:hypothetical protein
MKRLVEIVELPNGMRMDYDFTPHVKNATLVSSAFIEKYKRIMQDYEIMMDELEWLKKENHGTDSGR